MQSDQRLRQHVDPADSSSADTAFTPVTSLWQRRLGNAMGHVALQVQPGLSDRLVKGKVLHSGFQAFAVRALLARQGLQMNDAAVSALHRAWWSSRAALQFHRDRMNTPIDAYDDLLAPMLDALRDSDVQGLCEIGCGNGRMLNRVAGLAPQLQRLIGLDLNLDQVLVNRAQPRDPRVHYRAAEVLDWIPTHGLAHWAWLCLGGVLAYFSQREVAALFGRIAEQPMGMVAFAEPLADEAIIDRKAPSLISGRSRLLSHPYPVLLEEAGLRTEWVRETRIDDQRWLLVLARR